MFRFQFFMRFAQLLGVSALLTGGRNLGPLRAALMQATAGNIGAPAFCKSLLAVTAPILGGCLWVWLIQYFIGAERKLRLGLQEHPDEPWRINPAWAAQHIQLSNRPAVLGLAIAATLYVAVALPLAIAADDSWTPLAVGGAGLFLITAARHYWTVRRWNRAELRLGTLPGIVGGPFSGVVILHDDFPLGTSFEVSLKCQRSDHRTGRAVYSVDHTEGTTHWSSVLHIGRTFASPIPGTTAIPVDFAIPFDCPATTLQPPAGERMTRWKLSVSVRNSVGPGRCVFEVPVFKTAASRRDFRLDERPLAAYYDRVDPAAVVRRTRWRRSQLPDGTERWDFSAFNVAALVFFAGLTVVSGLVLAVAIGLLRPWPVTAFVGLASAAFVAIGVAGLFETLLWTSSLVAGPTELTVTSGLRGFARRVVVPRDSRTCLECQLDYRKGDGESWCLYLRPPDLVLETKDGLTTQRYITAAEVAADSDDLETVASPRLKLVMRLDGRREAETVAALLATELGITSVPLGA